MSQTARDLLWVVNSPSFVVDQNVAPMAPLTIDDVDVESLDAFVAAQGSIYRVGRYFEKLVHYWLEHVRAVELLGSGLQIRDGKRTIGELDFVYRNEDDLVVHCEVSVKFFLHHPRSGTSHFPGPNASDNFELKTRKLFEQQLELSRTHYPSVQRRHAIVKGMVFYNGPKPHDLPDRMNPDHATGTWLRSGDVAQLHDRDADAATIVQKPYWLAPQVGAELLSIDAAVTALEDHFAPGGAHPVMVSLRNAVTGVERERLFVVSAQWPER